MKYIKRFFESNVQLNDSFEEIIGILERDCKPFLDEIISNYKPDYPGIIFRGSRPSYRLEINNLELYKKSSRQDREPLDTDGDISKMFDDIFEKKFGVRPRSSGVFATKFSSTTSAYGKRYIFIPIGEYKYYWNPNFDDLFTKINSERWYRRFTKPELFRKYKASIFKKFYDFITSNSLEKGIDRELNKLVDGYKNDDLDRNTNQEIMFICKEYYLLDASWLVKYKEYLEKKAKN